LEPAATRRPGEEAVMMAKSNLKLIRHVNGPCASLRLYRYARRSEIVELVETHEGEHRLVELSRYPDTLEAALLDYANEVEKGVATGYVEKPKPAKPARIRRLGRVWKKGESTGGVRPK
jgi:hypothetical protein